MNWTRLLLLTFILSCSSNQKGKVLTDKEKVKKHKEELQQIRPLLISDDFPYMKCTKLGDGEVSKGSFADQDFWKRFGLLELREKGLELKANIMTLSSLVEQDKTVFSAVFYHCKKMNKIKIVGEAGMCSPSEERLFKIKYGLDEPRAVGEEIIRQVIRYHGLTNYYKTHSVTDIKYSYTNKEIQAKAKFFGCF